MQGKSQHEQEFLHCLTEKKNGLIILKNMIMIGEF